MPLAASYPPIADSSTSNSAMVLFSVIGFPCAKRSGSNAEAALFARQSPPLAQPLAGAEVPVKEMLIIVKSLKSSRNLAQVRQGKSNQTANRRRKLGNAEAPFAVAAYPSGRLVALDHEAVLPGRTTQRSWLYAT